MFEKIKVKIVRIWYKKRTAFLVKEANKIADLVEKNKGTDLEQYYEGFFAGMDYTSTIYGFVEEGIFKKYIPFD